MEKLLEVINVSKKYEGQLTEAVIDVSFELSKGEFFVLVGESGCGKTTLLKLIAGLEDADVGKIILEKKLITGPAHNLVPGHREVKIVFQDLRLFPNVTIYQNIEYALRSYHKSYQKERIQKLLQWCKLENLQHKFPRELSGGEQQRAALARALADEPVLLLLDEPFSNIDVLLKQQLKNDILDIMADSATTALFVTHDTNDALSMADRIAVMKEGKIIQIDKPQALYKMPVSPYVARFFGSANIVSIQWLIPYVDGIMQKFTDVSPDRKTEVCIRTEHIHVGTPDNFHFKGRVIRINYMGAYFEVEAVVDNNINILFRTTNAFLRMGEVIPLKINLAAVHLFKNPDIF